jgi:hypothetical protein
MITLLAKFMLIIIIILYLQPTLCISLNYINIHYNIVHWKNEGILYYAQQKLHIVQQKRKRGFSSQ